MRQELVDYIGTQNLGGFILSNELPYSSSGVPLYIKNVKRIYVDRTEFSNQPLIATLSGVQIDSEIASVRVYFASDAKQLPPNYDTVVTALRAGKDVDTITGVTRRECVISTTFQEDLLVTELEFRFTTII
jgi:hypothetical protein